MSIRVVARVRPQHQSEIDKDVVLSAHKSENAIKIFNPKNNNETYSFKFTNVYDAQATQQDLFEQEISPTIEHLFNGFDITIFAYGSTGTGKTHTMRGGKSLADRGIIPRFLSRVYRRSKRLMAEPDTDIQIMLSYYEIYNDKVFDLFEAPEKRTATGLALRESAGGKTVVVGLSERPSPTLKAFEKLYDEANINRSTSSTKLNASSSRSHAILKLNLVMTTKENVRISTASCIDLAGSEDNRRTGNGKERMVESASINKSLFTLAKCAEAISHGQNKGLTVMILNLAPTRSYHLDSLSSLTFANRTKKIEVREIENEPQSKISKTPALAGSNIQRQPLRPLHNSSLNMVAAPPQKSRQPKSFTVYSEKDRPSLVGSSHTVAPSMRRSSALKRSSDSNTGETSRPAKRRAVQPLIPRPQPNMSKEALEDMIERKVEGILAARALDQPSFTSQPDISEEVQKRLDALEKKIAGKEEGREQGLNFLLMAKQHAVRGEDASALRMYCLATAFFPKNEKLEAKIARLREKLEQKRKDTDPNQGQQTAQHAGDNDGVDTTNAEQARRERRLLEIINSGDVGRIRKLKGVGAKKAEAIIEAIRPPEDEADGGAQIAVTVTSLTELSSLKGVGIKAVESMMVGL